MNFFNLKGFIKIFYQDNSKTFFQDSGKCDQLFQLNSFRNLVKFLLGVEAELLEDNDEVVQTQFAM